jgi:hypothetical protein
MYRKGAALPFAVPLAFSTTYIRRTFERVIPLYTDAQAPLPERDSLPHFAS